MPTQSFDDAFRGMLLRGAPRGRNPGFLLEALNVAFPGGRLRGRPGLKPEHGANFAGIIRGGGVHYRQDGTRQYLVGAGTAVQRFTRGADPVTLSLSGLPSTLQTRTEPDFIKFLALSGGLNVTFIFDGVNTNLKWNGTSLSRMGLAPCPNLITATAGAAGSNIPAGSYRYLATLVSATHEGNPGDTPLVFTTASNLDDVTVTSPTALAVDDPSATSWRLYRTVRDGARFHFVDEADIGVDIVDDVADEVLDVRKPLERFANGLPPGAFTSLVEHRGQLMGVIAGEGQENIVYVSHIDQNFMVPEGWPGDVLIPIAPGDGDEIRALVSFFEWLVVFKSNSTWAVTGDQLNGFNVTPVLASGGGKRIGIGCQAPGSIFHVENSLIFSSRDAVYTIDRSDGADGGIQANRISDPIDDFYSAANFEFSAATACDRKRGVFIAFGHG